MRGMGTWLLGCGWVVLGVLAPGEGGGEGASGSVRWAGERCGDRAVLIRLHRGRFGPDCTGACPSGTSLDFSPTHVPWVRAHDLPGLPAPPLMNSPGIILWGLPCQGISCQIPSLPKPCPEAATVGSQCHCFQGWGLELSPASPTTSSGLTATGLPQSWARAPVPGSSSPGEAGGPGPPGPGAGVRIGSP